MDEGSRASISGLDVRLLGPIEATLDGEPVALGGPKPRALLAVLGLEPGRVVSVDRLVEALWPGDPPETAAHAVQVYVSQLRKGLGHAIATRPPGYELEVDGERIDVHRFARLTQEGHAALEGGDAAAAEAALREALALWRGPALADFLYEPFAQTEIARLEELRTATLEERIEADLALGRHAELVPELEALVAAQPLRERPRGQLMLALYRSGRQADALTAYRAARDILVDQLGIDPGPELRALEASILRQDDSLLLEEAPLSRPAMQFRRLVTILFADVVESMALAEALDPEALGRVLQRYFETVSAAITRHGGSVEKYSGDAVMAAFGIPVSHEDDALRAARAALDVKAGIAALNIELVREYGVGLQVRVGIETGEVVATPTEARQRLVTGEAVGVASRLEQAAEPDEIVVGELAGRLVDHAAVLEPLGALEIKGKREPVHAYRLVDLAPAGPAFESRLDAPLVGRKRELASLRRALKRAVDGASAQVTVVVGTPGVGKSRLASELGRRTKGVTTLWGRCLSYGDGITYWPLREVLAEAPAGEERDVVLAALEADTPPPAPEIAWLFRQFCEASARERPLVLVFDDVHWAEPTFLELVEHLADKGQAPILAVCVAREELLEERADFLEGRGNAARVVLDALSADETDALLDGLGGTALESDQRGRIVATAEGNPFFLEQLLALALEGGLAERALPETVQALLAARLDRLGPGERAVLERGAVVGKEFAADDVVELLDPAAAPTADTHLRTLADRGFVRPRGEAAFAFRHVLVQEAVYRSAPKRLRAELHERFADRLDETSAEMAELDEFVGYHLEQAYQLRTELGESDRKTNRVAQDAGRRLGNAGIRAAKRGDMHATAHLLQRAVALLPSEDPARRELLCELAIGLRALGDFEGAQATLQEAVDASRAAADLPNEWRARMELEYARLGHTPGETADGLLSTVAEAIPVFEAVGADRWLGRAWLFKGFVEGARRQHHQTMAEAAERALSYYQSARWPASTCVGQLAIALYFGPAPVGAAIERCRRLEVEEVSDRAGAAYVEVSIGGLIAQQGDFSYARDLVHAARTTFEELGQRLAAAPYCSVVLGDIELLADEPARASEVLRELCDELRDLHEFAQLASSAAHLGDALYTCGFVDEAEEWTIVAEDHAPEDDFDARVMWLPVRGKIAARRGDLGEAVRLTGEALDLLASSDALNHRAKVHRDFGEILRLCGRDSEAVVNFERAIELFVRKGNSVASRQTQAHMVDTAVVQG